ncbi:HSF-type DNA-binding protein [Nitzschia inconspicua]|uniref:HSF-type DNA-binding protein n=1 Tax=Nitzschia inconspicua TaxID=303405 RepID=A0A9K3LCW3_9STRA|nr:HSF-type DNA-binding protein [Nitzschia inconspicua]
MSIVETKTKEFTPPTSSNEPNSNVPSGFILKLFQMVNGAPDEVISWTPSGDAFIIGSDLQRLESETLPKYFRHNRFQSLVRQLNFYSFRKINRERNVWIYKHNLFHRDRQEELHLVRRRTCPGVDGRKQRFSRMSAQRLSGKFATDSPNNSANDSDDDDDDDLSSSGEDVSVADNSSVGRKREVPVTSMPSAKRSRSIMPLSESISPPVDVLEDVKKISPSPSTIVSPQDSEDLADDSSTSRKFDRVEMMQQSLVVSEVASKLEAYVKKAMKEKGLTRTRRGGSGIVTPPFGTTGRFTMNSSDLITYDDEYEILDESGSLAVVSETDDSMSIESVENDTIMPPVEDVEVVKRIRFEILRRASEENEEVVRACANVAAFFMLTAPNEDTDECCPKILELLTTSQKLEGEFYFYRAALHPSLFIKSNSPQGKFTEKHSAILRDSLNGGSDRSEALREFKIFSVNLIYKLLGLNGSFNIEEPFSGEDHAILLRTAKSWSKTIGIGA